jgi:hypothetical protein
MTEESELPQRWLTAVDELGLLFAHEPDDRVAASLEQLRKNLHAEFCALFPSAEPEDMEAGVDCIIRSIQDRKREIERDAIETNGSKN